LNILRQLLPCAFVFMAAVLSPAEAAAPRQLEIYFIDVEGGQATLVVTPDRHTLLIDTGWAGDGAGFRPGDPRRARDANRIVAAARDAGVKKIDYLLITHFHPDHDGGVGELSRLLPIRVFVDHGSPNPDADRNVEGSMDAFHAYEGARAKAKHLQPKPGDRLPLRDIDAVVVSAARQTLGAPLPGAGEANPACRTSAVPAAEPDENPRSTGVVITYGKFRFLDVGDLSGEPLFDLVCPNDKIGRVDAYLVAHHGGSDQADPAIFAAFKPRVALMNNGLTKGGVRSTYQLLHHVPGLEAVWQLHLSAKAADSNFSPEYIANLDESTAYWIKLVAGEDGAFRVFNPRTAQWKNYPPAPSRPEEIVNRD
jgi:beta-lactamase superfamily II metal-dependent hydrolase